MYIITPTHKIMFLVIIAQQKACGKKRKSVVPSGRVLRNNGSVPDFSKKLCTGHDIFN